MQDQEPLAPNARQSYAGIDVCKDWLDVHLHPAGTSMRVANDAAGLKTLKCALAGPGVARIVMEATGKFHRLARRNLHDSGFCVCVINPARARHFAKALGTIAKTDPIDARILALYGEAMDPRASVPCACDFELLQELVHARQSAMGQVAALKNQRKAAASDFLKAELAGRVKEVVAHARRLDAEIARLVAADALLARRHEILRSIPGVGSITAVALAADLAEMGSCANKKIAMLAGLAPVNCESGGKIGPARIDGGRWHVRTALFMAALAAVRCRKGDFKVFHQRLRARGKPHKVALVAVMRKIVELANTLVTDNRLWTAERPERKIAA